MKKVWLMMMGILLLAGCGRVTDSDDGFTAVEKRETASEQEKSREDAKEDASDETEEEAEETEETKVTEEAEAAEEAGEEAPDDEPDTAVSEENGFTWADVADQEFVFASGAGAWDTVMNIRADGSFEGIYHDSDMGDTGEGYPNGTVYFCDFSGRFSALEKENDYTYRFELEDIHYFNQPGEECIEDEILYKYTDAYGVSEGKEFYLYLPDAPIEELPEDFLSWVYYGDPDEAGDPALSFYGIYNAGPGYGFSGSQMLTPYEQAKQSLEACQSYIDDLNSRLEEGSLNQMEMNDLSRQIYEESDHELNYLWSLIKDNLPESRYQAILEEQRQWIKDKEAQVAEEGEEWGQGTMRPLVENTTAAELTLKRCYVLLEYLK